jgi:hypothetical protein
VVTRSALGWASSPSAEEMLSMIRHVIATANARFWPRAMPAALTRVVMPMTTTATIAGIGGVPAVWWFATIMDGTTARSPIPRIASNPVRDFNPGFIVMLLR